MRFGFALLSFVSSILAFASATEVETEPEVLAHIAFPEDNPFAHVVNGQKNAVVVFVENKSDMEVTLASITGTMSIPDTDKVLKNLSTLSYGIALPPKVTLQFPYSFHSEFKPGDFQLAIFVNHVADETPYQVSAYDSIITVVEPQGSIFDFQLVTTYLITAFFFAASAYFTYTTLFPSKKPRKATVAQPSAPDGSPATGYQEEWIPETHLRKASKRKGNKSGEELSGREASGAEGKKKGKK